LVAYFGAVEVRGREVLSEDFRGFGEVREEDVGDLREEGCECDSYDPAARSEFDDFEISF
jgi:hypothetical protein